jgi:two-component system alkaline phosphatase synthesis response regulator PhoP
MSKILVVDDDATMVRLLTMTMPSEFQVIQASDGEKAVKAADEHTPDVILMDLNMPNLNGFEALRKIRQLPKLQDTKIIMITARSDQADKNLAMQLGANAYMTKPFSPLALLDRVNELLGRE